MPGFKRRYIDEMAAEHRVALRNALWDGEHWRPATTDPALVERLAAERLIKEHRGRWVLTLSGHRHRRQVAVSW